ncbi:MAG TPA: beta-ribofuranosylaminobenzene 5'-phosphate synthase family protein [Vicinamibacterales bacterium]|nr:beta-ribofuranosylaminobenzene 5'-phosphate synthase family protein [Vicinamibacterales bacterium]
MSERTADEVVFVETAARLHFGVLDLRGARGRWFGGIGAAAPAPIVRLSAHLSGTLEVTGSDAERVDEFARRYLSSVGIRPAGTLHVHQSLPRHSGLGSGTQLALATARALAELHGLPTDVRVLADAVGRARRSAIGTWTFAGGGLVVEGGRRPGHDDCGPLISRVAFPSDWRCVVALPHATAPGISGSIEEEAFATLPPPSERDVERVAHLVLMTLLPALADDDLDVFGGALTQIQEITGCWFASVQGGAYARGKSEELVKLLAEWGAAGVGQSSWGPAVYGIVRGDSAAKALAQRARAWLGDEGEVFEGPFRREGARVWLERGARGS